MKRGALARRKIGVTSEVPLCPGERKDNVLEELPKLRVLQHLFQFISFIVLIPLRK